MLMTQEASRVEHDVDDEDDALSDAAITSPQVELAAYFKFVVVKGFGGSLFNVALPLFVNKRFAGDNPVRSAIYVFYAAIAFVVCSAISNATLTPVADRPTVGRKPLLVLRNAGSALALVVLGLSRTLLGLLAAAAVDGLLSPSISSAVLVDVLSRGARSAAFWRDCKCKCLGAAAPPVVANIPSPMRGPTNDLLELSRLYVASIVCSAIGAVPGTIIGTVIVASSGLIACLVVAVFANVFVSLFGAAVLYETLNVAAGADSGGSKEAAPSKAGLRAHCGGLIAALRWKPSDLWETLRGDREDAERRAYIEALFAEIAAIGSVSFIIVYYVLWRHDISEQTYLSIQLLVVLSVVSGFVAYWFYFKKKWGFANCLAVQGVAQAAAFAMIGAAPDATLLYVAFPLWTATLPALLALLSLVAPVASERQGTLQGALAVATTLTGLCAAAFALGVWLLTKGDAEHGSSRTRHNYASATPIFAASIISLVIPVVLVPAVRVERARTAQKTARAADDRHSLPASSMILPADSSSSSSERDAPPQREAVIEDL